MMKNKMMAGVFALLASSLAVCGCRAGDKYELQATR